jgi:site-specific recombinase XerD
MSALAPRLEAFFTERLVRQLHASPHTVAAYRDTFRLLLGFASRRAGKAPSALDFADLDAEVIAAFLEHLEHDRANCVGTRNARLAAVRSFFRFAAFCEPEHAELIARVLAIPEKRTSRTVVTYLDQAEIAALVAAPDRRTWHGRRDHALLVLTCQSGLRVAELRSLRVGDVELGSGAHVRVHGKGRKERCTPLTRHTVLVLRVWLQERQGEPADALFPTVRGGQLSHDAVSDLVAKHATAAAGSCPTLSSKRVTPHVLRHSSAMALLAAGVDTSVIALWLGHEHVQTTQIYLHGDLSIKERALARTASPGTPPGRYRPPDALLAFLESL